MKIKLLDAHDRFDHFTKQNFGIGTCCQNLIDKRPFGEHPFYIFSHARTLGMDERIKLWLTGRYKKIEDTPEKFIIWQPRLTKPKAQTNSMLFKAYPGTDNVKTIWIIPAPELWEQFKKGLLTGNETVWNSISQYKSNRESLESPEPDDLNDDQIDKIYQELSRDARRRGANDISTTKLLC
jgi:hypothetical protein